MSTSTDEPGFVSARDWIDIVSRIRFGTVEVRPPAKPGGKPVTVSGRMVKAVANRLAWYANGHDGTRVFPGPARLAVVCEVDYKTVKHAYTVLRRFGLITQVAYARGPQGDRKARADEYRLTIPADLLDHAEVLSPLELDREIERVRDANRGKRPTRVAGKPTPSNSDQPDTTEPGLEGTGTPPTLLPLPEVGGNPLPAPQELEGARILSWREREPRVPTRDQITNSTTDDPVPAQPPDARDEPAPEELVRLLFDLQRTQPDAFNALRAKARAALGEPITDYSALDRETWRLHQAENAHA